MRVVDKEKHARRVNTDNGLLEMNLSQAQYARLGVVASWIGVSPRTLQRDLARGHLHRYGKPDGVVLLDLAEVRRLYHLDTPSSTLDAIVDAIINDVRPARRMPTTNGRE